MDNLSLLKIQFTDLTLQKELIERQLEQVRTQLALEFKLNRLVKSKEQSKVEEKKP